MATIALSGCASAPPSAATPSPTPAAWSVSVHCEPVKLAPGDLKCEAVVKSLTSDDKVIVPPFVYPQSGKPIWYIPDKDAKGRTVMFSAGRARNSTGASWHLSIGQGGKQLLEYSGYVNLGAAAEASAGEPVRRNSNE